MRGSSSKDPENAEGATNPSFNNGAGTTATSMSLWTVVVVVVVVDMVVEMTAEVTTVVAVVDTDKVVVTTVVTTVDTAEATVETAVVTIFETGQTEMAVVGRARDTGATVVVAAKNVVETSGADDELFEYTVIVRAPVLREADIRVPGATDTNVRAPETNGFKRLGILEITTFVSRCRTQIT